MLRNTARVLIYLLAGFLFSSSPVLGENEIRITVSKIKLLRNACRVYFSKHSRYPQGTTGDLNQMLSELPQDPTRRMDTVDGWGNEFKYFSVPPFDGYGIISYGANGTADLVEPRAHGSQHEPQDDFGEAAPFGFDLDDISFGDFIRFMADVSGFNIVLDPSVEGEMTSGFDAPWNEVLDTVTSNCGLDYTVEGTLIWIAPAEKIQFLNSRPKREYTGEPFSFDFSGIDLPDLFRFIGDIAGLKVVLDPSIKGPMDLKLTEVPWDLALELTARYYGLDYKIEGGVLTVRQMQKSESNPLTKEYDDVLFSQQKWGWCLMYPKEGISDGTK